MVRPYLIIGLLSLGLGEPGEAAQTSAQERAAFIRETDQLKRDNPELYQSMRDGFTLLTEMLLGRLGYDVGRFDGVLDDRTRSAVRRYQRDHKIPETGDPFSFETVQAVRADDAVLNSAPISLQPKHVITDRWDRGFVSADGTWTTPGVDMASPEQTSNITCTRTEAICREARATVSGTGSTRVLGVDLYTFEIERWNGEEIATRPLQFGCAGTVLHWRRLDSAVTAVRRTTSLDGACQGVERVDTEFVLEDGNDIARKLMDKQREAWRRLVQIAPAAIRRLAEPISSSPVSPAPRAP